MTEQFITLKEVSNFWTRFTDPNVQSEYEQSQPAVLLKGLTQQRITPYSEDIPRGNWEDGPDDFSRPWLCKFDYKKLTTRNISLATVSDFLPNRYICVPGEQDLSATEISRALNAKVSKHLFGIFNLKQDGLPLTNPARLLKNSLVHILNSRNCTACPEWFPLDNYIQMATAWMYSDFHLDQGHTAAYIGLIEGEKLILMILNRQGLYEAYRKWDDDKYSYTNFLSFWFVAKVKKCKVFAMRLRAGELLYIPPGCVHAVLTLKSCITLSGNFFHKDFLPGVAYTWNYEFMRRHRQLCGHIPCYCDPTPTGYNKRICTLLVRYAALALNNEAHLTLADKVPLALYFSRWLGLQPTHPSYKFFQNHKIEECSCSLPVITVIHLLNGRYVKDCVLPVNSGNCPGWKSPQPLALPSTSSRHFTDIFREVQSKKPRLN